MALLEILTYPNPLLKSKSEPVENLDADTLKFIDDLCETMYASPGCVGIAAPQTGVLKRIIIVDASRNAKCELQHGKMILINPVVEWQQGEVVAREGCLSVPHFTGNVKRAKDIRFRAQTIDGTEIQMETTDFEARVILHEADHLDGLLFLDRVSSLKTDVFRRKRYL